MLAVNMLVISIFGSYQTAQAAEIVAGYTALEVIEGILLSFGISVFTTEMVSTLTEDPKTAQDEYWRETQAAHWAEYMEAVYEEERKKGGGGSGLTPTPGVTGSDIPSFKEVIQNMKNTGKIVLGAAAGAGVWECMSKAVSSLWDKVVNDNYTNNPMNDWNNNTLYPNVTYDGYTYFASSYYTTYNGTYSYYRKFYSKKQPFCVLFVDTSLGYLKSYLLDSDYNVLLQYCTQIVYYNGEFDSTTALFGASLQEMPASYKPSPLSFTCAVPVYMRSDLTESDVDTAQKRKEIIEGSSEISKSKENIWVHPDLQDTYKNNGKLEYPQQAPQPLQIPSIAQLTDLANKLKTNPQQSPNSVQELIDQLKQNPQPQPTVAPNPNPNPNPDPDPEVTPKPDDTTTDVNPDDYKADLRLVFPFCIPFDLVHLIQAFEAEPEAPVFEIPFDLELEDPWTGKKIVNYHHTFKLDFSDYESVIEIFRIFEVIFFIIGLLLITRQQMIKG